MFSEFRKHGSSSGRTANRRIVFRPALGTVCHCKPWPRAPAVLGRTRRGRYEHSGGDVKPRRGDPDPVLLAATHLIEHSELVADRIIKFAELVGR